MTTEKAAQATATKTLPNVGTDKFVIINDQIREMSRAEGERRFDTASSVEVVLYYERGAILHHAKSVWFKPEADYQAWVIGTLRIDLDLSKRLVRVYLAILHSGLASGDFRGIRMSAVLCMVPILRHLQTEEGPPGDPGKYDRYREAMPELLELARTGTVQEVKAHCYALRGMKPPGSAAAARQNARLGDWAKTNRELGYLGGELNEKQIPFAFFTRDPESGVAHSFVNRAGGEEFVKVWKEQCVPLLRKSTDPEPEPEPEPEDAPVGETLEEYFQRVTDDELNAEASL